ncbi:hypothetical protein [Streptomyces sp. NPDC001658]
MSSEPQPDTQPDPETDPGQPEPDSQSTAQDSQPEPPIEMDPPGSEPDPEEDTTPPPPPEETGETAVTVEPATWYSVTSVCSTTDTGSGQPCPGLNVSTTEPMVYSNAGTIRMVCGPCGKYRPILDATKLDPQPEVS